MHLQPYQLGEEWFPIGIKGKRRIVGKFGDSLESKNSREAFICPILPLSMISSRC